MSYLTQMAGLAVQNFVSAGVGMAVLAAVIRGIARRSTNTLGNFWRDLYRSVVFILLPLSILLAVILISQGVPQTFHGHATATTLQGAHQMIARGPYASQEAIKQLGTNGGGPYNANSSVPFENPNGLTNFLELLAILLIPAGQVFMFGRMVNARRHAAMVFAAMFAMFAIGVAVNLPSEQHGSQVLRNSGVNITQGHGQSGGNMADKEVRFGIANTATWTVATSDASNGSVNGGFDAQTPSGGAVPLVNLFVGEVIFGGVGSGLYGMFFYILIAVFIAGLMVGRTPEYLGKKIEAREIKIAALGALFVPTMVLVMAAVAIVTKSGLASVFNQGVHGFTETLYAYDSQGNNNGSAFAGYGATSFSATLGTVAMYFGRFVPLLAALALGGSLAQKKSRARVCRHLPHGRPDVRRAADGRDRADGRSHDLAGADARPDRRRADALMTAVVRSAIVVVLATVVFGFAYPALMTALRVGGLPGQVDGQPDAPQRAHRRLAARGPELHLAALLPRASVRNGAGLQRRRDDVLEPRADELRIWRSSSRRTPRQS